VGTGRAGGRRAVTPVPRVAGDDAVGVGRRGRVGRDDELDLLLLRVDRLLAMDAPETALELLATVPAERATPALQGRRLLAWFAADQTDPACAAVRADASTIPPWTQARVVCAALAGDPSAVELGLDLLAARGETIDPNLAALARALASDGRARLEPPVPDDPLLLPLLRRAQLDLDPSTVGAMPPPARRALLANGRLPSAVRAAAAPNRPGPSARPELNGSVPGDWTEALAGVPVERRAAWAALVDGLGAELPEPVWSDVGRAGEATAAAPVPAPDLYLWRGYEVAAAAEQRGAMLLHVLLLLDGRPETAAPVTLRRALDGLAALDLQPTARALAAGTGGALGL
jgi:hypothetical protein